METFIVVSAHPEDLADGSLREPGSEVRLSAEERDEPHNAAMIEDGRLLHVPVHKARSKPTGDDGKGGDS